MVFSRKVPNGITDCCPLLTICPKCCPRHVWSSININIISSSWNTIRLKMWNNMAIYASPLNCLSFEHKSWRCDFFCWLLPFSSLVLPLNQIPMPVTGNHPGSLRLGLPLEVSFPRYWKTWERSSGVVFDCGKNTGWWRNRWMISWRPLDLDAARTVAVSLLMMASS